MKSIMKLRQAILIGVVPAGYFGAQTAVGGLTPPFLGFLTVVAVLVVAALYRRKGTAPKQSRLKTMRDQLVEREPEPEKPAEEEGSVFGTTVYTVHHADDFWHELPDPEMII